MGYKISVIGLGKLGACIAAVFAANGVETIGIDINTEIVEIINQGETPYVEPKLQDYISKGKNNFSATLNPDEAILNTDISFIVVPTPSQEDGNFSDQILRAVLKPISLCLRRSNKDYHLFVISSTVSPGTIDKNLIPLIEEISKKKLNKDFGICYSPLFIALGSVINDFLNPNLSLIGESDVRAGNMLNEVYRILYENNIPIARMSIISAEIMKIALNSYVTLKISFANFLANVCSSIANADIDDITKALGQDLRGWD